jgi:hypothetical protein
MGERRAVIQPRQLMRTEGGPFSRSKLRKAHCVIEILILEGWFERQEIWNRGR